MGFFNAFKSKIQKQEMSTNSSSLDNSMNGISSLEDVYHDTESYLSHKMNELDSSPVRKSINSHVSQYANDIYREMVERKFDERYKELTAFQIALEFKEKHGIKTDTYDKLKDRYETLINSGLLDENNKNGLFLPYLLERDELGIISEKERRELNILKNSCDVNKTYRAVAVIYQLLGFGNLEDDLFLEKSFPKYGNISEYNDEKLVRISRQKFSEMATMFASRLGFDDSMTSGKSR